MTVAAPDAPAPRRIIWANIICLFSILAWCAGLPAAKALVATIPPVPLTALRTGLAGVCLVAVWAAVEGLSPLRGANWRKGVAVGAVVMGAGALGMAVAIDLTDAVTVAIITAAMPIIGLAMEVALDGRRLTVLLVAGLILGVVGGLVALDVGSATPALGWGALASLVSVLAYVWGSRETIRGFPDLTPLGQTAITVMGAGIATSALALVQGATVGTGIDWPALDAGDLLPLAATSLFGIALAQTLWIVAVSRIGVGVASMHNNAAPFYVMLYSVLLGGAWHGMQALGAAIVIVGVLVAQGILLPPGRLR